MRGAIGEGMRGCGARGSAEYDDGGEAGVNTHTVKLQESMCLLYCWEKNTAICLLTYN